MRGTKLARTIAGGLLLAVPAASMANEPSLAWIPGEPALAMGFHDDGAEGAERLRDAMLFAAELIEPFDRTGAWLGTDAARDNDLVVSLFTPADAETGRSFIGFLKGPFDGERRSDASHRIGSRELFLLPGEDETSAELALAFLDDDRLAFGNVSAVLAAIERFDAKHTEGPATSWLDGVDTAGAFWGAASSDWLGFRRELDDEALAAADVGGRSLLRSLREARGMRFSATGLDLRLVTRARDDGDAEILRDALASYLAGAGAGAPAEVSEVLSRSTAERAGSDVQVAIPLSVAALERLHRTAAARNLFRLRVGEQARERTGRPAALVEALGVPEGGLVADIGAGNGFFTVRLARHVGPTGKVFAVDVSEDALGRLRHRTSALDNVDVVQGAFDDPRLPEAALDAVLIVNAYHEMEQFEAMLSHIRKSLKPGGRLALLEPYTTASRTEPRSIQVDDHTIAPELVVEDLTRAGFEVVTREDTFIEHDQPGRFDALVVGVPRRE